MEHKVGNRVKTQNMDGKYNNVTGVILEIFLDYDTEPVCMIKYDIPIGSCTKGMFKESDLQIVD